MIDVVRFVQHLTVAPGVAPDLPLAAAASNSTQPDSASTYFGVRRRTFNPFFVRHM